MLRNINDAKGLLGTPRPKKYLVNSDELRQNDLTLFYSRGITISASFSATRA